MSENGQSSYVYSVSSFLDSIKNNIDLKKVHIQISDRLVNRVFFRGQFKCFDGFNNLASLFRQFNINSSYGIDSYEYNITDEFMRSVNLSGFENNFARLSYMQHYGLPTRLLDVTTNPLVALYFACISDCTEDGIVNIYFSSNESNTISRSVNSFDFYSNRSHTLEILSTLSLMAPTAKMEIFSKIRGFEKQVKEELSIFESNDKNDKDKNCNLSNLYDYFWNCKFGLYEARNNEEEKAFNRISECYDELNNDKDILSLYTDIQDDIGFFNNRIDFLGLIHPFFVSPAINNPRIKAQSGFFMFQPYDSSYSGYKGNHVLNEVREYINNDIENKLVAKETGTTIIIPGCKKRDILKELDINCSINRATLFPDSENIAKYIKNDFIPGD